MHANQPRFDFCNYLAIDMLERLGIISPDQRQINEMERTVRMILESSVKTGRPASTSCLVTTGSSH